MLFSLEALTAEHGDCLLLHWGTAAAPRRLLIDGGPPGVYQETLRPRLTQLRRRGLVGALSGSDTERFEDFWS